jgi:glycosyltransferase involved in cell wall biosynthesis
MIKYIINQSSRVIVANEYEKQIFLSFCDESRIEIVRNGIDLNELNSELIDFKSKYKISSEFILFVGRFSMVKGVDLLLQAINRIKDYPEMSNVKTVIMGVDFGFEKRMFEMVEELQLREKIIIIKNPARNDVISAYAQCKFLVLPSRWELSPLTPLEGFVFKKAVISSKVHGIPFTIEHDKNAILVEPEDYQKIGDAIMELIRNKTKCIEYGIDGYKLVTEICNSDKMADNMFKVYQKVINR